MTESKTFQNINNILSCPECGLFQPMFKRDDETPLENYWKDCKCIILKQAHPKLNEYLR